MVRLGSMKISLNKKICVNNFQKLKMYYTHFANINYIGIPTKKFRLYIYHLNAMIMRVLLEVK